MSFLTPWISWLGDGVCGAALAVLPAGAGAAVCETGSWQAGMTVIALTGGMLAWWETRRRSRRRG